MKKSEKKFDKAAYNEEYQREKYDRIVIKVRKGDKDILRERDNRQNKSLQQYIKDAIEHYNKLFD